MDKLSLLSWPTAQKVLTFFFFFFLPSVNHCQHIFQKKKKKTEHYISRGFPYTRALWVTKWEHFVYRRFFFVLFVVFFFPLETFSTLSFSKKRRSCFLSHATCWIRSYLPVVSAFFVDEQIYCTSGGEEGAKNLLKEMNKTDHIFKQYEKCNP